MKKILLITLIIIYIFSYTMVTNGGENLFNKGVNAYVNENYQKSIDFITEYITENDEHYLSYYYLGLNYLKLQQNKLAYTSFKKADNLQPGNYKVILNLGRSCYYLKKYKEAEKYLTEAVECKNSDEQVYNLIALLNLNKNNYNEAVKNFKKAVELDPDNYYVLNNLGYCYLKSGNYTMARKYLKKAAGIETEIPYIYNNLGIASENLGLLKEALKYFKKALTVDPEYYKAEQNYDRIKNKINNEE